MAYLFDELEVDTKLSLEKELAQNENLRNELADLQSSISFLKAEKPMTPNPSIMKNILEELNQKETILAD